MRANSASSQNDSRAACRRILRFAMHLSFVSCLPAGVFLKTPFCHCGH